MLAWYRGTDDESSGMVELSEVYTGGVLVRDLISGTRILHKEGSSMSRALRAFEKRYRVNAYRIACERYACGGDIFVLRKYLDHDDLLYAAEGETYQDIEVVCEHCGQRMIVDITGDEPLTRLPDHLEQE